MLFLTYRYPTSTNWSLQHPHFLQSAQRYMAAALAPTTRSSYTTGWSTFSTFCTQNHIHPIPFNQDCIVAFIVHAIDLHLAPSTIKSYISGIQYSYRLRFPVGCLPTPGFGGLCLTSISISAFSPKLLDYSYHPERRLC
ncbi:UNVERIFIED_CONTAM: hypothetical protein FKN15_003971 [Acipenser sinensis]